MKKLFLAVIFMISGLVGVNADVCTEDCVASIGNDKFYTIMEAVESVEDNNTSMVTIKVLKDSLNENGVILKKADSKKITIDFDNHKVAVVVPVGSKGTQTQAFHFEEGNEVVLKNGTLEVKNGSNVKMAIQNYTDLTLENFKVDASETSIGYAVSNNAGDLKIIGNSSIIASDGKVAFDLYWWPSNSYKNGPKVTVNTTGTIDGKIELTNDGTDKGTVPSSLIIKNGVFTSEIDKQDTNANIEISGGTFNTKISDKYLADKYIIKEINSKYVVVQNVVIDTTVEAGKIEFKSDEALDNDYVLSVKESDKELVETILPEVSKKYNDKLETKLLALYSIDVKNGEGNIVKLDNGKYTISIPIEKELQKFDKYKVIYVNDSNVISEELDATLVDGNIIFNTTHLSIYGIVGYNNPVEEVKEEKNPQTIDNIMSSILLGSLSLAAFTYFGLRLNKKIKSN